jgi:hypothetical protein
MKTFLIPLAAFVGVHPLQLEAASGHVPVPTIVGDWWSVADNWRRPTNRSTH